MMSNFTPAEYIRDTHGNLDLAAMWIARIEWDSAEALQGPYQEVTVRCEECKEPLTVDLPYLVGDIGFTAHSAIGMALSYHAEVCEGYRNVEVVTTEDGEEIEVCGACEGTGLQEPCSACQRLKPLDEHLLCRECSRVLTNSRASE